MDKNLARNVKKELSHAEKTIKKPINNLLIEQEWEMVNKGKF